MAHKVLSLHGNNGTAPVFFFKLLMVVPTQNCETKIRPVIHFYCRFIRRCKTHHNFHKNCQLTHLSYDCSHPGHSQSRSLSSNLSNYVSNLNQFSNKTINSQESYLPLQTLIQIFSMVFWLQ